MNDQNTDENQKNINELSKIRELLIGKNLEEIRDQFIILTDKIAAMELSISESKTEVYNEMKELNSDFKEEINERKEEESKHDEKFDSLTNRLENLENKLSTHIDETKKSWSELRQDVQDLYIQNREEFQSTIKSEFNKLNDQKLEKSDLAKLFSEVSDRIQDEKSETEEATNE